MSLRRLRVPRGGLTAGQKNEPNFIMFIQLLGSSIAKVSEILHPISTVAFDWRRHHCDRVRLCRCGRGQSGGRDGAAIFFWTAGAACYRRILPSELMAPPSKKKMAKDAFAGQQQLSSADQNLRNLYGALDIAFKCGLFRGPWP